MTRRKRQGRTESGATRREALVKAGLDLFLRHGFVGTSLDLVIERAGGSKRAVYEEFGNKQGLFVAAIESALEDATGGLVILESDDEPPEATLVAAGTSLLRSLLLPRMLAALRLVIAEVADVPELGVLFLRSGPAAARHQFAAYLERQTRLGILTVSEPEGAAAQLLSLIRGELHLRALVVPRERTTTLAVERQVRDAVATFLRGVD